MDFWYVAVRYLMGLEFVHSRWSFATSYAVDELPCVIRFFLSLALFFDLVFVSVIPLCVLLWSLQFYLPAAVASFAFLGPIAGFGVDLDLRRGLGRMLLLCDRCSFVFFALSYVASFGEEMWMIFDRFRCR